MATEVIHSIRSSGGDYTSLTAWETAQDRDLVTADEIAIAECYDDWANGLSDNFVISGWTTSSTCYIEIRTATGNRHTGVPKSGFFMVSPVDFGPVIDVREPYVNLIGLDVENTSTFPFISTGIYVDDDYINVVDCLSSAPICDIYIDSSASYVNIINCLCYGTYSGEKSLYMAGSLTSINLYNCIFKRDIFSPSTTSPTIRNCILYPAGDYDVITVNSSSSNNAAYDGSTDTPPGNNPYTSNVVSGDFVNASSNNFHLSTTSGLIGEGANLYSIFTTDIDGDVWPSSGAWNIGFDYFQPTYSVTLSNPTGTATGSSTATIACVVTYS